MKNEARFSKSDEQKEYMKNIYSHYWIKAREKKYGFSLYDKNLLRLIESYIKTGSILEVAIGTGYPIADFLQKKGYAVSGIDISPDLINKCHLLNPEINCKVGDAEDLDYPDESFDCTYCFHSSWYIPDLNKAIDEMIRVTRPDGLVIFDIENRSNKEINRDYKKQLIETRGVGRIIRVLKNIAKIILRKGTPKWHFIVYENPSFPERIYAHLKEKNIEDFQIMVRNDDETIKKMNTIDNFPNFGRLIFVIRK
jgi:ubiquinone/menaquinone biosynthesis C-methylase UbiE